MDTVQPVRRTHCLERLKPRESLFFSPLLFYLRFHHGEHQVSSTVLVDDFSLVLLHVDYEY